MANTETTINAVIHPQPNETPINIEKTIKALERNKFVVHYFETGAEAVAYLKNRIQNKCVAIGDSRTLLEIGVHDALSEVNEDIATFSVHYLVKAFAIRRYAPWDAMYFSPR